MLLKEIVSAVPALGKLAAANPAITNPNLIYPGQVLTIPAADHLPGAAADAPSVALAGSVQWDAVAQRFS